jgi:putative membrane protein insertion efficiency factor
MHAADAPRLSPAQRIALGLIRAYKVMLSAQYAGSCRFLPSCSEYAAEAVRRFGVVRGSLMALQRLSRCHPLGASGHDPVPPRI